MKRMERQADQTDRALARLALTSDMIGGDKQQRQMANIDRGYRQFGRTADDTGGRVRKLNRDLEQNDSRWQRISGSLTRAGGALMGVTKILGVVKLPAMGAGIGVLVQGVGALAGGIIALLPRITDLAGGVGVLGPTVAGMGLAMITAKLATHGLSQALAGNAAAFKRLTPEAKKFVTTLHEYRGIMRELRTSAQSGLFRGLDTALPRLTRGVPVAKQLLGGMSSTLGGLAVQGANRITTPGALQDILAIGQAGTTTVGRAGTGILNILDGMRHLTVAAIPFTNAVSKALVRFTQWFDKWAQFQRDSGRAAAYFERSRKSFDLFGRILRNVFDWFQNLGRAARGTGDTLWAQAERATKAWAKWSATLQGQVHLTRQFVAMRGAVTAIVTLFDDLVRAIFRMGTSGGLAGTVNMLGTLVPALEKMFNLLANQWGPILASVLVQVANTLAWLTAATGPLTIFLTMIDRVLRLINGIVGAVPGLGAALGSAFSVVAIGIFVTKLRGVTAGWFGVASAANTAAAAEARALALGGASVGGGAGGGGGLATGAFIGSVTRPGVRSAFGAVEGAGLQTSQFAMKTRPFAFGLSSATGSIDALAAGSRLGRLGGMAGRLGGVASKFALPITAALGAFGAITAPTSGGFLNQAAQRSYAGMNAVTFGGYGAALRGLGVNTRSILTPDQLAQANIGRSLGAGGTFGSAIAAAGGQDPHTRAQLARQVALYEQQIADYSGRQGPAYKSAVSGLQQQLSVLRQVGQQLRRNQMFNETGGNARFLRQEGGAFDILSKRYGASKAAASTNSDVLGRIRSLKSPQAKQSLAQNYLKWLTGEDKRDPRAFGAALQHFERAVGGTLGVPSQIFRGGIVTGTAGTWNTVRGQLLNPIERARERGRKKLTDAQERAVLTLSLLGAPPAYAASLVMEIEHQSIAQASKWTAGLGGRVKAPKGGPTNNSLPGGFSASGLQPGVSSAAQSVLSAFPGLSVSSTLRPQDKGSYHSIGEAVDIAGPPGLMGRAARWINATMGGSLLEGIHNSGLSIKNGQQVSPSFWGASTWAGHANHIHLALGNSGAGLGAPVKGSATGVAMTGTRPGMLQPRRVGRRAVAGTLADQLGMLYGTSTSRAMGTAMSRGGTASAGSLTGNRALAYSMMLQRWPAAEWTSLNPLWTGESNFNNLARNSSSGAFGIPQALPASKMGPRAVAGDAASQIAWGLDYIQNRYGSPTQAYKTWEGRSPHWYRDGGSGTYRRPTMIGVGDNPRGEKVTVTPLGGKTAGASGTLGNGVVVHIGTIQYNGPGDIHDAIMEEFRALAHTLEHGGGGTEETM